MTVGPGAEGEGLRVALLTSSALGCRAVAALAGLPGIRTLTLVTAPAVPRRRTLVDKVRQTWRYDGPGGIVRATAQRLRNAGVPAAETRLSGLAAEQCPAVPHVHLPDFQAGDAPARLAALRPDLGIVVATHRLQPALYQVPRLGSINLHFGCAPEYRGSSPAFWELYDGVPAVGVTVHWVNEHLDAGDILLQECVPLDLAPGGDPLAYLERYQRETLVPLGFGLLARAVAGLTRGPLPARPQDGARGRTRRRATWRDKVELRRRVAARRRELRTG